MTFASEVLARSPLAYWRLGETSGTTLADSSGNGRDITISTGTHTLGVASLVPTDSSNLALDTTSITARIAYASWMDLTTFSLFARFQTDTVSGVHTIVCHDDIGNTTQIAWRLRTNGAKVEVIINTGTTVSTMTSTSSIAAGVTYSVGVTYDGSTLKLFINEVLDKSQAYSGALATPAQPINLGCLGPGSSSERWDGRLDEVAVFGTAISDVDMLVLHNAAQVAASMSPYTREVMADSPVVYWKFDETSGTVAADSSGNARDGTIAATPGVTPLVPTETAGHAVNIDVATSDQVSRASEAAFNMTAAITVEGWFYLDGAPGSASIHTLIGKDSIDLAFASRAWVLYYNEATDELRWSAFVTSSVRFIVSAPTGTIARNGLYYIVGTYDGAVARLYVNGTQVATATQAGSLRTQTLALRVGKDATSGNKYSMNGQADEVALYASALSATRIAAHYATGLSYGTSVAQATETDLAQPMSIALTVNQVQEADSATSMVVARVLTQASEADSVGAILAAPGVLALTIGQALETDLASVLTYSTSISQTLPINQVLETGLAQGFNIKIKLLIQQVLETDLAQHMTGRLSILMGRVVETDTSRILRLKLVHQLSLSGSGTLAITSEDIAFDPTVRLTALDTSLNRAPTSLTFTLAGANPGAAVSIYIDSDSTAAWTGEAGSDGEIGATSINIPVTVLAGAHQINAHIDGALVATADFVMLGPPAAYPTIQGPDAQAVEIPGAVSHDTRHWVFQDLLAEEDGGIGSYVLPRNPRSMTSPHLEHGIKGRHTTAITGQYHLFQTGQIPKEWSFTGYCATQEMQEKILQYRNLNRRFYLIDHHNRAWKILITNAEFVPRKHQVFNGVDTDWGSDYTVTATILDQDWVTPA